jgi:hypothetical protein
MIQVYKGENKRRTPKTADKGGAAKPPKTPASPQKPPESGDQKKE